MKTAIKNFLNQQSSGGIILMLMVALAMIMANSPLDVVYDAFLNTPVQIRVGALDLDKPMLLWINDLLMAFFFLLIGLEVKRELLQGTLSSVSQAALPTIAAIGGMVIPALVFLAFNASDATAANGWAIPAATDIAFALGVLALLGSRVPVALKVFLLALAIIDDLLAIMIIALFYSGSLSTINLVIAALAVVGLFILNRSGVRSLVPYMLVGTILWIAVLKSGVHATLAGVVLAFTIPLSKDEDGDCPSEFLEHKLHPWSTFMILPIFAFANAGVSFDGLSMSDLVAPLPLGIALGLVLGKPLGILGFSFIAVKLKLAKVPDGISWTQLFGVSLLCGIGFTMAMFVASLAFEAGVMNYGDLSRLGILLGSALSAIGGYMVLKSTIK
ncbi:sodium/proton antiporter, NhaA family [Ferrimonas sediminum]|uniref:Na(+)/H(+) antiporter NhaA n=1 Tax=Ferrimonas sediminum TaxID=718193 RepID=A0A1G8TSS3_9GAMM|nr:Na+/H+ antiporter NhaA [Ferrimonas sediminum]SDJ44588.1 sodium/proton antiporter, NhaA family [Ferrimonas sediminum]